MIYFLRQEKKQHFYFYCLQRFKSGKLQVLLPYFSLAMISLNLVSCCFPDFEKSTILLEFCLLFFLFFLTKKEFVYTLKNLIFSKSTQLIQEIYKVQHIKIRLLEVNQFISSNLVVWIMNFQKDMRLFFKLEEVYFLF